MSAPAKSLASAHTLKTVAFGDALRVWWMIGLLSFGGPAGQIALMHKELVEKRRWIDEERFLHALNYCMLLPGPEAQQLATYIGWLMHKTRGGIAAGTLFIIPGFVCVYILSVMYATLGHLPAVTALFFGLKAAVLAVVFEAVFRISKRALKGNFLVLLAGASFVAMFFFAVPFPAIIFTSGLLGVSLYRTVPGLLAKGHEGSQTSAGDTVIEQLARAGELEHTRPSFGRSLLVVATWGTLWLLPFAWIGATVGKSSVFFDEATFFSKAAISTFGGAYAVLGYVAQRAVESFGWLKPLEMLDGLGLAETTPGPLILVLEFVGFLGAYRQPGALSPLVAGSIGAVLTVWVTFVPCFLWIFLGAPYIEALRGQASLRAALSCISAAVVGVVLNLSVWLGLHILFHEVETLSFGPVRFAAPTILSFDFLAGALCLVAAVVLFRFRIGVVRTLLLCASLGLLVGVTKAPVS